MFKKSLPVFTGIALAAFTMAATVQPAAADRRGRNIGLGVAGAVIGLGILGAYSGARAHNGSCYRVGGECHYREGKCYINRYGEEVCRKGYKVCEPARTVCD
jgi:uncharacterized membrane protein